MSREGTLTKKRAEELKALSEEADGYLKPQAVVDFARNPNTALHGAFCWDDTIAAEKYRLVQARQIITLHLTVVEAPGSGEVEVQTYTSLKSDRYSAEKPGYTTTARVMSTAMLRAELLETALFEFRAFRRKYEQIRDLVGAFDEFEKALIAAKSAEDKPHLVFVEDQPQPSV